jgi:cyclopropane fatty-acyl-phospholipid synthase-like methyltransferase
MSPRLRAAYFDELYARDPDPWDFATSEYEAAKYEATIAALDPPYASALEVGCSIGVLTARLAERCERLLAIDVAASALEQARERAPRATFERREVPEQWPDGPFDLIVCSEVLYYLGDAALDRTIDEIERTLVPGGSLLAVHWRHQTRTYPLFGDEVHGRLRDLGWPRAVAMRTTDYILERFDRP